MLQKAIDLNPRNARAHFYLGKIYTAKKNYPEAIKAYSKVTDLAPAFPDAFFNLGFIYYRTGDYAKAEEMFQKVVALSPNYLDEAYFNLAMVQNLQGKSKESIRNLERALEVNPKNDRAKKYLLRLKRTSQNRDEKNRLENEKFGTDRTSFALVLWWLCDDGQICAAGTRKPSFLG